MSRRISGFTLVELLIVIVVVAILAGISIVAYNGIQDRARKASLSSDLATTAKQLEVADMTKQLTAGELPAAAKASSGNVLQLANTSGSTIRFCINGYGPNNLTMSYWSNGGLKDHLCDGAGIGSAVGGNVPTAPRGSNLVSDFSTWTLSGGVTYDSATGEIRFNSASGSATSPLVRVDDARYCRLQLQSYATQPSPMATPQTQDYVSSLYYGADGITQVQNSSGYTSNGNAQAYSLNSWYSYSWNTPCGPGVKYVKFRLNSAPTSRTSDNRYRNPQISVSD